MIHRLPLGWILFFSSFIFFWIFSDWGPITDPVESNYALPAKEMILSNDWLTPHIYGKIWFDKPILIYWLTAISFKLFGFSDGAARLVPAVVGAGGISLIFSFTSRLYSRRHGLVAALILATSIHYFALSKALVTDMLLFVTSSAGLVYFYMGYSRYKGTNKWYLWMYPCLALAVLSKGPVGALVPGLIMFIFLLTQKKWSELLHMRMLIGIPIFLLIAAPWFLYMYHLHGKDFVIVLLGVHNFLRATQPEHPENNVFYFYPAIVLVAFLPWTGFVLRGLWKGALDAWKEKAPIPRFLIIWIASYYIFYSLMATKYPTYLFPIWFPGALLAAIYLPWVPKKFRFFEYILPIGLWWIALMVGAYLFIPKPLSWFVIGLFLTTGLFHLSFISRGPKGRFLPGVVLLTISCYLITSAFLLPNAALLRSGIQFPAKLVEYKDDHVGFFQTYSTGSVYYGGPTVTKVVLPEELPNSNDEASWNLKYQMPLETTDQFAATHPTTNRNILFLPESKEKNFYNQKTDQYEIILIEKYQKYSIIQIKKK